MEDKILQKAGDMFLSLGFKSVTMDDIANELGISKKTLYKYFANKALLVSEATKGFHKKVEENILTVKNKNYNAIEEEFAIKAIFKEMLKNAKESPMFQLKKYYPEIYKDLMDKEECMFSNCNLDNLQKGIFNGLYRADIDTNVIMRFYFTLIFTALEEQESDYTMQEIVQMEYKILEYHIRAIATEEGVKELEKQLKIINQNK